MFKLDPEWEMNTALHQRPKPPQAIYCGEVVVGHRYDRHKGSAEEVVAVGCDPFVQGVLDQWFSEYVKQREAARAERSARFYAECAARNEDERRQAVEAVRNAIGGGRAVS